MPATVVRFRDVGRPPARVFVDTSFIRALIQWSVEPNEPRCAGAHGFYQTARTNNAQIWTTPFTAEEILWNYVRRELQEVCRTHGLVTIGDLKRTRRADYRDALFGCRPELKKMVSALNRFRISFEFPGDRAAMRGNWGAMVWQRVAELVDRFEIETADAFHIACATVAGTTDIASLDDDFKEVDGLTVYCYS